MRNHPEVSQLKFAAELERLRQQRRALESRGIWLVGDPTYPRLDAIFVPRHPVQVIVPVTGPSPMGIILPAGSQAAAGFTLENVAARAFKARFDLSDFDMRAPSVVFLDPWTDEVLKYPTMFRALEFEQNRKAHVVLLDDHPMTHRPFLCLRGIREYHEHPQHTGDDWMLYRPALGMFDILLSVWRVTVDLIHANVHFRPGNVQTVWTAEEKP